MSATSQPPRPPRIFRMQPLADRPREHLPVVGLPACRKMIDPHPYHVVGEKYLAAVRSAAGCMPIVIPALGERLDRTGLLGMLDGLLLTGSHSNVEPHNYGRGLEKADTLADPHRDTTVLPLVRESVEAGVPLLAICRGFQEVNVAFGGTLHQHVEEQPGLDDHREQPELPLDERYGPMHAVEFVPGGFLERLAGAKSARVNSLHGQGVDQLADGLVADAHAPDGIVEAYTVRDAPAFALGVQWHPEWKALEHPLYAAIFDAFGNACRARAAARGREVAAIAI